MMKKRAMKWFKPITYRAYMCLGLKITHKLEIKTCPFHVSKYRKYCVLLQE